MTPADVIDDFNVASLVTTGLFWLTLGGFTGPLVPPLRFGPGLAAAGP